MANQIKTKFIGNDQINSDKILLENDTPLRGKDSSGTTVDLLKIDATDKLIVYRETGAEEIAYISDVNAGGTALQDHIDDLTGAHAASAISVVPAGDISSTDVQAALEELDSEKLALAGGNMTGNIDMGGNEIINSTHVGLVNGTETLDITYSGLTVSDGSDSVTIDVSSISGALQLLVEAGGGASPITLSGDQVQVLSYIDMNNNAIVNVLDPSNPQEAATKNYVDNAISGVAGDYVNTTGDTMTGDLQFSGSAKIDLSGTTGGIFSSSDVNINSTNINLNASLGVFSAAGLKKNNGSASGVSFGGLVDSMTLNGGSSSIEMTGEITMNPSNTVTINGSVDMQGHEINDVSQLTGLSAAVVSGNALRYDELGAYSISAGYGIATLDNAGKIPAEQLPAAIMEYKGTWDASTNTPTLANGSGANAPEDAGHLYIVSVGGTVNFGAGNISFNAGDSVILSASLIWEKSTTANLVTSVNGAQGVVVLDAEDLNYHQSNASDWTVADDSSIKMTLDEVGQRLTAGETADLTYLLLDGSRPMQNSLQMSTFFVAFDASAQESAALNSSTLSFANDDVGSDLYSTASISRDYLILHREISSTEEHVYTMQYNDGKLSLTEGASEDPMVPTLPEHVVVKAALDSAISTVSGNTSAVADDVSHLVTLSGMPVDSDNLGSFSGSTIPDSQTVKQALQSLETAHEAHLNDSSDAHMASSIGLSPAINSQTTVQGSLGDHESRIDALEAVVHAAPYKKTLIAADITNKYIDLPDLAVQTNGMSVFVDRLAMHQDFTWVSGDTTSAGDDYRISVVGGVTRITFLNDMVGAGSQKLAVGDTIYVRYQKNV